MENKRFDDQIRQKMSGFEPKGLESQWDAFEKKLELDDMLSQVEADESFDEGIREGIEQLPLHRLSHHWALLEKRLAKIEMRRKMIIARSIELALILLLIFSLRPFLDNGDTSEVAEFTPAQETPIGSELVQEDQINPATNSSILEATPETSGSTSEENNTEINSAGSSPAIASSDLSNPPTNEEINYASESSSDAANSSIQGDVEFVAAQNDSPIDAIDQAETFILNPGFDRNQKTLPSVVAVAQPIQNEIHALNESEPTVWVPHTKLKETKPARVMLGVHTGLQMNMIRRPSDPSLDINHESRKLAVSPSGGIDISFEHYPFRLLTGLNYSRIEYKPNIQETAGGIQQLLKINFSEVKYHMASVPVTLQYYFGEMSDDQFYGSIGASIHAAMYSEYKIEETKSGSLGTVPRAYSRLKSKNFAPGLLEGGAIVENSLFTVDLGMGYERTLNSGNKWFLQLNYQHIISPGIGPTLDEISNLQFVTGVRLRKF